MNILNIYKTKELVDSKSCLCGNFHLMAFKESPNIAWCPVCGILFYKDENNDTHGIKPKLYNDMLA